VSLATVGLLILAAALVAALLGIAVRTLVGRNAEVPAVRRTVTRLRGNAAGRVLFGPSENDALDSEELDQMILLPTIVVVCGLVVTAVFVFGYALIA
jgi:preprotein translocase subunit Sec61beta